jgi:hypothetical protein
MNISELINEIISEWAYRIDDGQPNPKNPTHIKELGFVLSEMGLSHIKNELIEGLLSEKSKTPQEVDEADKQFTNPILNKSIKYKNDKGEDKEGIVGNLLRLPKDNPGRVAAEKMLPADAAEKDAAMKDLGSEKDGKSTGGEEPKKDGEEAPKGGGEEEKMKQAQAMFDPKADPAMGARLDKEKEIHAKLAGQDSTEKSSEETPKEDEKFNPIEAQDIQKEMPQADPDTFGGGSDIPDGVPAADLEKFNTDINKVAKQVADAKAKGEPAPNINLCDVTIPGTNLYCDDNLGIPRDEMPQFKGTATPGSRAASMDADASGEVDTEPVFREMLQQKGIKVLQTEVPADKLKATQKDLVGAKVVGMMGALEKDPNHEKITAPIYVSRDGYVIDGHHRWAAIVAYNAQHPDNQIQMKTTVLDQDIKDAIPMANKFAEDMGIAAKKADANKEAPTSIGKDGLTDKIKSKIQKWTKEEKEFFEKGGIRPGSEVRRTFGEAIKHKAAGAWHAIKKGAKHEVEEFKAAGEGVGKFFKGDKLSHHEKDALKAVGIKIATTALFGAAFGGLAHGAAAFGKHVAMEFIPHVVGETILKGTGRAALFADADGSAEMDANMEKFAELIAKGVEEMEISPEQLEQMVDSYNKKKESGEADNVQTPIEPKMKEENLQLADELMLEMIYGFIEEAGKPGESKEYPGYFHRGGGYYSTSEDGEITHKSEKGKTGLSVLSKDEKDKVNKNTATAKPTQNKPVAGADLYGQDYKDARGGEKKTTTKKAKVAFDDRIDGEKALKLKETYNTDTKFSEPGMTHDERVAALIKKKAHKIGDIKMEDVYSAMGLKEGQAKFPAKYMSVLTNALNFGKGPYTITDLTDAAGAGTLDSTLGELVVLMGSTLKDENQRKQFFDFLREKVKAGGEKSPITMAWVNSGQDACDAWHRSLSNYECPGGYETNGNFWDIPSEAKAAGIKNYKADKGKSTDVNTLVNCIGKDGNMTQKWLQPSLKKNKKVNAFNSTTGRVYATTVLRWAQGDEKAKYARYGAELDSYEGLDPLAQAGDRVVYNNDGSGTPKLDKNGNTIPLTIKLRKTILNKMMADIEKKYAEHIPEQADPQKAIVRQSGLHKKLLNDKNALAERDEFLTSYRSMKPAEKFKVCAAISKNMNQKGEKYTNELMNTLNDLAEYDTTTAENFTDSLTEMGITNTKDSQKLMIAITNGVINTKGKDTTSAKFKAALTKNSHDHSKAVLEYLIHDNDNKKALLENISTAFPLKDLMEGKEWAILGEKGGGINLNKNTITKCLGATKFDEVVEKMVIVDFKGEPTLAYAADNGKRVVPIGVINCRPDGIMYGGTWKLELSIHEGFSDCCKAHDK